MPRACASRRSNNGRIVSFLSSAGKHYSARGAGLLAPGELGSDITSFFVLGFATPGEPCREGVAMQLRDLILVSVDDHLIEPQDMFVKHMPARFKDHDPDVRHASNFVDGEQIEGHNAP